MDWLKRVWDWIVGAARTLLDAVLETVLARAREILERREVAALALEAIRAAAREGLTGEKAWVAARDAFTAALKGAGLELGACAVDTTLQTIYDAWKELGYPEEGGDEQ